MKCVSYLLNKDWIPLNGHMEKFKYIFLYKLLSLDYCPSIADSLCKTSHDYGLRSKSNLQTIHSKSKFCSKSILSWAPKKWNSLPLHLRNSSNLLSFKSKIKLFIDTN